jgi:hypothetical protein
LLFLRLVRLADEISLERAARCVAGRRTRFRRQISEAILDAALPLEIDLGAFELPAELGGGAATARARVFAFGVISVVVESKIEPGTTLAALADRVAPAASSSALDAHARRVALELGQRLRDATMRPVEPSVIEDYTIVALREVSGDLRADDDALVRLLVAEPSGKPLSTALRKDVLARSHQWFEDDLVIVHYETAVVLEPGQTDELWAVIELALTQLLEFRARDAEIDDELKRVYAELASATHHWWWLSTSQTFRRARDTMERLLELGELADAGDNATKFAADLYLASLYVDALERFRVADWRNSVQRKLGLFNRVYELLKSEGDVRRSLLLEITMVLLVLVEVVVFIVGWHT